MTNRYLEKIAEQQKKEPSKLRAAGRAVVSGLAGAAVGGIAGAAIGKRMGTKSAISTMKNLRKISGGHVSFNKNFARSVVEHATEGGARGGRLGGLAVGATVGYKKSIKNQSKE